MEQENKEKTYKIGDTFHLLKGPLPAYKCHIVGIVDENMIVYKWYGRHKQWWHYSVEAAWLLDMIIPNVNEMMENRKRRKK